MNIRRDYLARESPKLKPKVSIFIWGLGGGAFTNLGVTWARGFLQNGCDTDLIVLSATKQQTSQYSDLNIVELGVKRTMRSVIPLVRYLRRNQPDLLLVGPTMLNFAAIISARIVARVKTKVIVTEHTSLSRELEQVHWGALSKLMIPLMIRVLYTRSNGLVAVGSDVLSDHEFARATENLRVPVSIIPNPVTERELLHEPEDPQLHPWLSAAAGPPVILTIGRLAPQKGLDTLLDAAAVLKSRQIKFRLLILGEGELRSMLEEQVDRLGLSEFVALPGFSSYIKPSLALSSVFVLSSRWEGNPLALIEAMAARKPVVATASVSGVTELIDHEVNGLLVPVDDSEALANGIARMLNDRNFAKMMGDTAGEITTRRNAKSVANDYLEFLASL